MPPVIHWLYWIYIAVFALIAGGLYLARRRPSSIDNAVSNFGRTVGLAVPADVEDMVRQRVRAKLRWSTAGSIAVPAIGLAMATALGPVTIWTGNLLPLGLYLVGMNVGNAFGSFVRTPSRPGPTATIEPARTVSLDDYVPRQLQVFVPMALGLALVVVAFAAVQLLSVHASREFVAGLVAGTLANASALAAISVVAAVVWLVAAATTLRRPQPARSFTELAWSDALRADYLNSLAGTAAIGPLYCVLSIALFTGTLSTWIAGLQLLLWVSIIAGAAMAVMGILVLVQTPQRYYLQRLWPDTFAQHKSTRDPAPAPADADSHPR